MTATPSTSELLAQLKVTLTSNIQTHKEALEPKSVLRGQAWMVVEKNTSTRILGSAQGALLMQGAIENWKPGHYYLRCQSSPELVGALKFSKERAEEIMADMLRNVDCPELVVMHDLEWHRVQLAEAEKLLASLPETC